MRDFSILKKDICGETKISDMAEAGNIDEIIKNLRDNNILDLNFKNSDNDSDKLNEILCELLKAYQLKKFENEDITHDDLFAVYLNIMSLLDSTGVIYDDIIELGRTLFYSNE